MKNMVTFIAALSLMISAAPINALCAADTASVSASAADNSSVSDIRAFTGKWTHQVSSENDTVDKSAKNIGTMEVNADATYKYTDAQGKTSAGTIKLGTDNIGGTEFTVLSFYEGAALKYTAYYLADRADELSLGNGGLARFVKETEAIEYLLGDVNNDNVINAIDASNILSCYAMSSTSKGSSFSEAQMKAADVNSDGSVNSVDASCVLSYYAYNSTVKTQAVSFEKYLTAFKEA